MCGCVCIEIIEKTASFVARVGENFEKKVAEREKDNPKFAFLKPTDAYHMYYRARVGFFKHNAATPSASSNTTAPASSPATPALATKPKTESQTKVVSKAAETISAPPAVRMLQPPPKDRFSFNPPHIPLQDLFVIFTLSLDLFVGHVLL